MIITHLGVKIDEAFGDVSINETVLVMSQPWTFIQTSIHSLDEYVWVWLLVGPSIERFHFYTMLYLVFAAALIADEKFVYWYQCIK
jgi:hypothetical protein